MDPDLLTARYYATCVAASGVTAFLYDYFDTFVQEASTLWPSRFSLGKVLFLLTRYTPFIDLPVGLLATFTKGLLNPSSCSRIGFVSGIVSFVGTASSEALLVISLHALLGASRKIGLILAIVYSAGTLTSLSFLLHYLITLEYIPSPSPEFTDCMAFMDPLNGHLVGFYILLAGEICIALIAVICGLRKYIHTRSPLMANMYRDGTFYFIALMSFTAFNIAFAHLGPVLYRGMFVSWQRILHAILASRLVLNVRSSRVRNEFSTCSMSDIRFKVAGKFEGASQGGTAFTEDTVVDMMPPVNR